MAAKSSEKLTDNLMQFASVQVDLDAADASTLVTSKLDTNMSVRGNTVWKLHRVDCFMQHVPDIVDYKLAVGLSTRAGLTAVPAFTQKGCIQRWDVEFDISVSGVVYHVNPRVERFVPAVPIAAPGVNLYAAVAVDQVLLRGAQIAVRLGFTTAELDRDMRQELLDVWGWGS